MFLHSIEYLRNPFISPDLPPVYSLRRPQWNAFYIRFATHECVHKSNWTRPPVALRFRLMRCIPGAGYPCSTVLSRQFIKVVVPDSKWY